MQDRPTKKADRFVRKQLLLTKEQDRRLKALAADTSRSEAELVREALEEWLARQPADQEDWKKGLLRIAGMWADYPEVEEAIAGRRKQRRERRERLNRRMRGE